MIRITTGTVMTPMSEVIAPFEGELLNTEVKHI